MNDDLQSLQQQIGADSARSEAKLTELATERTLAAAKHEEQVQALLQQMREQQDRHQHELASIKQQVAVQLRSATDVRVEALEHALSQLKTEHVRKQEDAKEELENTKQAYEIQISELQAQLHVTQRLLLEARQDLEDHLDHAARLLRLS